LTAGLTAPILNGMRRTWGPLLISLCACGNSDTGGDIDATTNPGGDGKPADASMSMPDVPGGVGEPAELMGITAAHNQVRAGVQTANPLPPMQWNPELAATAAAWVAMCRDQDAPMGLIDHNPDRSVGHPYYVGENVFGSSGGNVTPQQVVNLWAAEASNYNYATNTCNGICGHYTQIVWRTSVNLGCAKGDCPGLTYRTSVVCNYGPGGNNGGRPY
jgi:hypothetical protein